MLLRIRRGRPPSPGELMGTAMGHGTITGRLDVDRRDETLAGTCRGRSTVTATLIVQSRRAS